MFISSWPALVSPAGLLSPNDPRVQGYLDVLEEARGEFFRHLGVTCQEWQDRDTLLPVVECVVRYRCQARYDDLLRTEVKVNRAEGVRIVLSYQILNEAGRVVVEAETVHACTTVEGKPKRLPEELKQAAEPK